MNLNPSSIFYDNLLDCNVKLMNFENAGKTDSGTQIAVIPYGSLRREKIMSNRPITPNQPDDLYALGLICSWILSGDHAIGNHMMSTTLSDHRYLDDVEVLVKAKHHLGIKTIHSLLENKITAGDAAIAFNNTLLMSQP